MNGPRYSIFEQEIMRKYYPIFGNSMLAQILGRSKKGITQMAGRLRLRRMGRTMNDSLRHKIYERDRRLCQLCGEETRFFRSAYDSPFNNGPRAGSVDHIIPVSKGGTDDERNLRWTCRSCNCARGNRA